MKEIEQVISMKQRCLALLAILLLLGLASCGMQTPGSNAAKEVAAPTETTETVPETTVPPDGDPNSVTCKGSYTATATNTAAVASPETRSRPCSFSCFMRVRPSPPW